MKPPAGKLSPNVMSKVDKTFKICMTSINSVHVIKTILNLQGTQDSFVYSNV